MWRIRYTLRRRPTIAVIDATGRALIVRRLVRDHREGARVDHIAFASTSRSHLTPAPRAESGDYGKRIRPAVLRDDVAMWVTSNGCVDEAPHDGGS